MYYHSLLSLCTQLTVSVKLASLPSQLPLEDTLAPWRAFLERNESQQTIYGKCQDSGMKTLCGLCQIPRPRQIYGLDHRGYHSKHSLGLTRAGGRSTTEVNF